MVGNKFPQGCPLWFGGKLVVKENVDIYKDHRDKRLNARIDRHRGKATQEPDVVVLKPSYRNVRLKRDLNGFPGQVVVTRDGRVVQGEWTWVFQLQPTAFPTQAVLEFVAFPQEQTPTARLPAGNYEIMYSVEIVGQHGAKSTMSVTSNTLRFSIHTDATHFAEPEPVIQVRCWKDFLDKVSAKSFPTHNQVKNAIEQLPMYRYIVFEEKRRQENGNGDVLGK
jgi:hypothetical protein